MPEDLRPLCEDVGASDAVRRHLREALDQPPVGYDVEAGFARHRQLMAAGIAPPGWASTPGTEAAVSTAAGKASGGGMGTLLVGLVAAIAVGAGIALALQPAPGLVNRSPALPITAPQAGEEGQPTADPVLPIPVPAPATPAVTDEAAPQPAVRHRRTRTRPRSRAAAQGSLSPVDDAVQQEIAQMGRARARLARSPAAALKLLRVAERQFPSGFFVEEREALSVLALARLHRSERARARGESFLARYPSSSFGRRVREALSKLGRGHDDPEASR